MRFQPTGAVHCEPVSLIQPVFSALRTACSLDRTENICYNMRRCTGIESSSKGVSVMRIRKAASVIFSAAFFTSTLTPLAAYAEGEHIVIFHLEEAGGSAPVALTVGGDDESSTDFLDSAIKNAAFNERGNALVFPEPVGGKAVGGWTVGRNGTEPISLNSKVEENLDLYPLMVDVVSLETIAVTFDSSALVVGQKLPDAATVTAKTSVPADAPYTLRSAGFYDTSSTCEADHCYYYYAILQPKEGTVFNYTYAADNRRVYDIAGAAVNGEHAAVQWDDSLADNSIVVYYTVKVGNPEMVNVTLHSNNGTPDKVIEMPKGGYRAYTLLDDAAGERIPQNGDKIFDGWCYHADLSGDSVIPDYLSTFIFYEDSDLYARWADVITEVNLTIETPLCGQVVEYEDKRYSAFDIRNRLRDIEQGPDGEGVDADPAAPPVSAALRNEPQVTCDVPSLMIDAFWILSDVAPVNMTADTEVEYFLDQMIHGENEYLFAIAGRRREGTANPYFSKDLKITVNGVVAAEGAGAVEMVMPKPGANGSKAGKVTQVNTVQKNGSRFVVVGAITADHDWDDGVIKKEADCDEEGEKLFTCRIKDASYTEEIDPYGHRWEDWVVVKAATKTEDGLEQRVCDNNGEHKETRVIPKGTRLNDKPGTVTSGTTATAPKTGDADMRMLLSCGAAAALLAVLSVSIRRKKQ